MTIFKKIKSKWDAYLERLGEANKKTFGEGPLECCKLSQYDRPSAHQPETTRSK